MNKRLIASLVAKLLLITAGLMLPALAVALYYREDPWPFVISMAVLLLCWLPLSLFRPRDRQLRARDGFVLVGLSWLALSLFGALPFLLSGAAPGAVDALFESVSAFTTTGASVLPWAEGQPQSILFWRNFSLWIGGMGVLVLTLALLPQISGQGALLARVESPGPSYTKLLPRMRDTSRVLYRIYAAVTLTLTALLWLSGIPPFEALLHAMGTAGTGGFSSRNLSIGAYNNPLAEGLIAVFMLLSSVNFMVYARLAAGEGLRALRNEELRAYLVLTLLSTALVSLSILPRYGSLLQALRHGGFQVSSIISTTAYVTDNYDLWPQAARILLVLLMIVGGSAGSTAGGLKVVRVLLLGKMALRAVSQTLHPRRVRVITLDGKAVAEEQLQRVAVYVFIHLAMLMLGSLVVSLDGVDFVTSFSACASALSNIGPGLNLVGPHGNYGHFSPAIKLFLSFLMLAGRLEFFPMLLLLYPGTWRRG